MMRQAVASHAISLTRQKVMISISYLEVCRLKFESYALGARIYMNQAIDLKEVRPGVYGIPPKREPFFQPGLGLKVVFFFLFIGVSQLVVAAIASVTDPLILGAISVIERSVIPPAAVPNSSGLTVRYRQR